MAIKDVSENTVSSKDQLPRTSSRYYLGNPDADLRILIVGNSITRHAPSPEKLGWYGDWGMAASSEEHDFVHRLASMLAEDGKDALIMVRQAATWERGHMNPDALADFLEEERFDPDILVFRIGENVKERENYYEHAKEFISFICKNGKTIITTNVWTNDFMNPLLSELSKDIGASFVDLTAVGGNDELMATGKFEHKGVAMHPGDAGMEYIAKQIFEEIKRII